MSEYLLKQISLKSKLNYLHYLMKDYIVDIFYKFA
jgi:hypothetical protein